MFGKIIDNKLVLAGNKIKTPFGFIVNPKEQDYIDNGWKEVEYTEKPTYDKEEEKLVEVYSEDEDETMIFVDYEKVSLTDEEHNSVIQTEIIEEENKITARNIREAIKGDEYALNKITEIENKIQALREKLV